MPRPLIDLTGQVFGRWRVINLHKRQGKGRPALWNCECECGNKRIVAGTNLRSGISASCGCLRDEKARTLMLARNGKGARSPHWKGGRILDSRGYARVWNPTHSRADKRGGYVYEHLLVMEEALGRPVNISETVHHVNGHKADNRLENLELWSKSHPPGQRTEDKIAWAKDTLLIYIGVEGVLKWIENYDQDKVGSPPQKSNYISSCS